VIAIHLTNFESTVGSPTCTSFRVDALEAKLDAQFERLTTRMIIAMVLSQTATGPIGMHVLESLKQVLATLGR
jgi:hypothetical protein